jgi:hypothetical protein
MKGMNSNEALGLEIESLLSSWLDVFRSGNAAKCAENYRPLMRSENDRYKRPFRVVLHCYLARKLF